MRKHNMLLGTAAPPTKSFQKPKQVITTPMGGGSGTSLTHQQYSNILKNINQLHEQGAVQRKEYEEYVDYNEKATVRSDYNINEITTLAKSLELLIYDLQRKLKVQDKWNEYFKTQINLLNDDSGITNIIDSRISQVSDKLQEAEDRLNNNLANNNSGEVYDRVEVLEKQVKNLVRILERLPGFVTSIDSICNKDAGGFDIKYKTISFDDIDLNAELPVVPDEEPDTDPEEDYDNRDPNGGEEEIPDYPWDKPDVPDPEPILDPISSAQTEVTLTSPVDMKFSKLYADSTKLTDINKALTETKDAITQIKTAITSLQSSTPTIIPLFVATINVYQGGPAIGAKVLASNDLSLGISRSANQWNLTLTIKSTSTEFSLYGVSTSIISGHDAPDYNDELHSGRGDGVFTTIVNRIYSSSKRDWGIDLRQYSQGNENNNSWGGDQWDGTHGVYAFYIIGFGTIGTTSSSSSPTVNITPPTVPTTADFTESCGAKSEVEIKPEPEPEPEEEQ